MTRATFSSVATLNGIVHTFTDCRECTGLGLIRETNFPTHQRRCRTCEGRGYIRSEVGRVFIAQKSP